MHKPVTIKEIAKSLNISVSTVSRGLHDHPSICLSTRQKIKEMADEMRYDRNQTAIFFQQGKTFTIGVILPELSEAFFSSAMNAIEDTAYKRNYTILSGQSHDNEQLEKELVEKMRTHRVDGIITSLAKTTTSFEHFEILNEYNIPVVFFDRVPPMQNIHYVACNIEAAAEDVVNCLLRKGHRTIGMINGPDNLAASNERLDGYVKALLRNRLKFDPSLVINCSLSEEETTDAMDKLLDSKRKPSAIVAFNDYVFLYALNHVRKKQMNTDPGFEFASFGNLPITDFIDRPPLLSIEQFPYLQAQKATDILLDLLSRKENGLENRQAYYQVMIESKLVEKQKAVFASPSEPVYTDFVN